MRIIILPSEVNMNFCSIFLKMRKNPWNFVFYTFPAQKKELRRTFSGYLLFQPVDFLFSSAVTVFIRSAKQKLFSYTLLRATCLSFRICWKFLLSLIGNSLQHRPEKLILVLLIDRSKNHNP